MDEIKSTQTIPMFSILENEEVDTEKLDEYEKERAQYEAEKEKKQHFDYLKSCNIEPEFFNYELKDFIPRSPSQEKAKKAVETMINNKSGKIVLLGSNGIGKEEWVEQIIPTPQGFRRFGDLNVGDYVYDETGKPTKVLGVFPQGMKDSYKVFFTDGRSDECGLEHLWGIYTKSHGKWKYQVLSLNEMLKKGITQNDGFTRFYIQASPVIECEEKELPCDPYILGSFIGNGCCTSTYLCISSNDEWQVKKCAEILGCTLQRDQATYTWYFKKGQKVRTDKILPKEVCCYAHEKRIPKEYIFASAKQRQSLLQGLFDTDGCAVSQGKRLQVSYSTTSLDLANDVKSLLLTFGIVSTIYEDSRNGKRTCYGVRVNCSVDKARLLFSLPRKLEKVNNPMITKGSHRDYTKVGIKSVEKLKEKKEMMCIWVENENHLYLTKDFLVTHNTMLASIAAKTLGGKIYTMYEISTMIRQSYTIKADKSELEIVNELASIPFLAIDELGRTKGSDTEQNWLSYILDKRHTRNLPFMLLSNSHLKKDCPDGGCPRCFQNFMDNDILSRLRQNTVVVVVSADDIRSKNHTSEFWEDK